MGQDLDEDVFDEDLSDPEPESDADDETPVVRCDISDHDSDCGCSSPDASDNDIDEDGLSETSYDGPDADDYYRLKELPKEEFEELKQRCLHEEDVVVKKIQEAIEAVRNAESRGGASEPFKSVANTEFHLYCVDHVKHCFWENYSTKRVDFLCYVPDKDYGTKRKQPPTSDTKISGQIYLTSNECVPFEEWVPPEEAGPKKYSIKDSDGKFEFTFQFISNDYLIATVPREFVFLDAVVDPLAPKMFTMYGVRYDFQWLKKKHVDIFGIPNLNRYEWKMPYPMEARHQVTAGNCATTKKAA
ncbi:hypothetical protein ACHAO4_007991 [Trichoderma viride]